jgi:hypothetical protein
MKLTPRDGRNDHDLVALVDDRGKAVGETDVLVVEVDGDERIELARCVAQARTDIGKALHDVIEDCADGGAFGDELTMATGLGGEGGWEADWDRHEGRDSGFGFVNPGRRSLN